MNVLVIAITAIISFLAFSNDRLKQRLLFYPYGIHHHRKEYYRFITHGFIHADMMHLLFNMITLYFFGGHVEQYLNAHWGNSIGSLMYIAFYFIALIVAALPSYYKQKQNQYYRSLGASGAVSALLFASILIQPLSSICLYFAICIPAYVFGPLYLIYSVYEARRAKDNIAHDAHFTGAIFGLFFIILLVPQTFSNFIELIINLF